MKSLTVKVKQGFLRGTVKSNVDGGEYISFQGIPFAEPPLGELRFKDPQPVKPWTEIRDAVDEDKVSLQMDNFTKKMVGSEDCLYLNIATNSLSGKKPVMVFIHGGGFIFGYNHSKLYSPDYLLKHDVVFVSINYRLGMLGFLNMDVEDCPGNQGLKDQVLALNWIQENIEAFGGDKNNVTIFGQSAGSVSVHCLCLKSSNKELFHKAILQSGSMANPWAYRPSNKDVGFEIAKELGKETTNPEEVVKFFMSLPPEKIIEEQTKRLLQSLSFIKLDFTFGPTMDCERSRPYFIEPADELMKKGIKIPVIIGYTSHEAIALLENEQDEFFETFKNDFENILAQDLKINVSKVSEFAKDIRKFYFKDESNPIKHRDSCIDFKTDTISTIGILDTIYKQINKKTPTYVYRFSHNVQHSCLKVVYNIKMEGVVITGAAHCDDLNVLFHIPFIGDDKKLRKGTQDYLLMQRMTKMWTDFAKTGCPTPKIDDLINVEWKPFTSDEKWHLEIQDKLTIDKNLDEEKRKLWKPILNQRNIQL
ncbi:esterase B1-like isoform X1 [Belonocnema kinseyi]|uniref:esterase B1-like isoform X1 n=2 Tax=Belonocnema kinseyi TaxID=2817044 RepID=UPI00143CE13B|nr:esterase B1-like isoform X1 [Belonocnema kinseyi]